MGGRIKALEANLLQDLHHMLLLRAVIFLSGLAVVWRLLVVVWGMEFAGATLFVIGCVLLSMMAVWMAMVLRDFASTNVLVRQAARTMKGLRKDEAELADKTAATQLLGLAANFSFTILYFTASVLCWVAATRVDLVLYVQLCTSLLDCWVNLFSAMAFSGALTGAIGGGAEHQEGEVLRRNTWNDASLAWHPCEHKGWGDKVKELATRGFTLNALMKFYRFDLPWQMPNFDPSMHRTTDVVRCAIIPLSREKRTAYSTVMMDGEHIRPMKMVTHNWSNLFRDLVAAILADALDEAEYDMLAGLLDRDAGKVEEWIAKRGVGERSYWVCAFSVSQHSGICSSNHYDRDPITNAFHDACNCGAQKYFNDSRPLFEGRSIGCEMNKFDEMMAYLSAHDPNFSQVIAIDAIFDIFSRAWCVSEIAMAHAIGMKQHLKIVNACALEEHAKKLRNLRIEEMRATRVEDIQEILASIPDVNEFNRGLQALLFDKLLPSWRNLDAQEQMCMMGRIARWQMLVNKRDSVGILQRDNSFL